MEDRKIFLQNIARLNEEGRKALMGGAVIDQILVQEINSPGTDTRHAVNLFCKPPQEVKEYIQSIQDYLKELEPAQYYSPLTDLHMTLIEFCHSKTQKEAESIAGEVRAKISGILEDLPDIIVGCPVLGFDQKAIALNFMPYDGSLQAARQTIIDRIKKLGITFEPRYLPKSCHITIMRYTTELRSEPRDWVKRIQGAPKINLEWKIRETWLTWGATWYCMQSRINQCGPYRLNSL